MFELNVDGVILSDYIQQFSDFSCHFKLNKSHFACIFSPCDWHASIFLKILSGNLHLFSGKVDFCFVSNKGATCRKTSIEASAKTFVKASIKSNVGYLSRTLPSLGYLTLRDLFRLTCCTYKLDKKNFYKSCSTIIETFFLSNIVDYPFERLCVGDQRMILLVLILVRDPHVILLDEPFMHLCSYRQQLLLRYLIRIKNDKIIVITGSGTTFDRLDKLCDHFIFLKNDECIILDRHSLNEKSVYKIALTVTTVKEINRGEVFQEIEKWGNVDRVVVRYRDDLISFVIFFKQISHSKTTHQDYTNTIIRIVSFFHRKKWPIVDLQAHNGKVIDVFFQFMKHHE